MTTYRYPFSSEQALEVAKANREGKQVHYWVKPGVNLADLFLSKKGTVLEIGGPSDCGYLFLQDVEFSAPVVITNIKSNPFPSMPDAKGLANYVKKVVDARSIPYPDGSLAIVLAQHISMVDDSQYDFTNLSDKEHEQLQNMIDRSRELENQIAKTGLITEEALRVCLRLAIAKEVYTKLQPGGLYVTDVTPDQRKALEILGFSVIAEFDRALLYEYDESHYDVVLVK